MTHVRVSRVAAHIAAVFSTEKHSTRQHNLPVTAMNAVDGISSVTVVDLQLGSNDPQASRYCRNRDKNYQNGNFIYTTVKWAEFPVVSRNIHTGLLSVGNPLGSSLFTTLSLELWCNQNHHFRSVAIATSHILSKHNRLYTCTRTCIIVLYNVFYFSSSVATFGAPIDSATWLPVCWTRVVLCIS